MAQHPDYRIRSFHGAFLGELTIYSFGKDLRPWRPIPARAIFWMVLFELLSFITLHVTRLHMPLFTFGWAFFYLLAPGGLSWLCTVSRIEGRRLHNAVGAWMRYAFVGRSTVGGFQRLGPLHTLSAAKVKLLPEEEGERRSYARYVLYLLIPVVAYFVLRTVMQ